MIEIVATNAALILALMTVLWLVSVKKRDVSIVDAWWSIMFLVVAVHGAWRSELTPGKTLLLVCVAIWALRLWLHLLWRGRGKPEDPRYGAFRQRFGAERYWWVSFFQVFVLQGVLALVISAPLQVGMAATRPDLMSMSDQLGAMVFAVGFLFETIADAQLASFRTDPSRRGGVLDTGLWAFSRHPNYFGETMVWWGLWLCVVDVPNGATTFFAPLLLTVLLLKVSGVTMLDAHLQSTKLGWADYARRTPAFVPLGTKKALAALAVILIGAMIITFNLRLRSRPRPAQLLQQLSFLEAAIADGAPERMQRLFPEGYLFTHALYALSWIELGLATEPGDPIRVRAREVAAESIRALDSEQGRAPFSASLAPPYGMFYAGWLNWLRGSSLELVPKERRSADELAIFWRESALIAEALDRSPTPFLESYPGRTWPVDSVVGVASLALCDTTTVARHKATIARWLEATMRALDPATGLIPHEVSPAGDVILDGPRGSSQSVMLRFLPEIDRSFAARQLALAKPLFVTSVLGFPGMREFPTGEDGQGDVDSGPLVFGISMSATVVLRGAAQVIGDDVLASDLDGVMAAFGFPLSSAGQRRYALGLLPVGDAFVTWSQGARAHAASRAQNAAPFAADPARPWRWPTHVLSLVVLALFVLRSWRSRSSQPSA